MRLSNQLCLAAIVVALAFHFQGAGGDNPDQPAPLPPAPGKMIVAFYAQTNPHPPYTHDQDVALNSARSGDVRKWIDENCKEGGLRVVDPDQPLTEQSKFWQDAFANPPPIHPAVKLWNGRKWGKWQAVESLDGLKQALGVK